MKKQVQDYEEWLTYQRQWFKTPRGRYHQHKGKATARGVPFLLTFDEWWDIWQVSGKWEQRGRLQHQYVMARYGDQGPYERSNVRICLAGENTDEMRQGLPPRSKRSPEEQRAANRGYKQKERQDRMVIDPVRAAQAMGRRMVMRDGRRCWSIPGDQDYPD